MPGIIDDMQQQLRESAAQRDREVALLAHVAGQIIAGWAAGGRQLDARSAMVEAKAVVAEATAAAAEGK